MTRRNNELMLDVRVKSRDAPLHVHEVHDTIIETLLTKSAVGVRVIRDIFHSAETRDLQESSPCHLGEPQFITPISWPASLRPHSTFTDDGSMP